ncbi:MAG: putative Transglycosylase [Frankiales bacterium]|nr:putative Transglycosylase [Frankiales bacterium]
MRQDIDVRPSPSSRPRPGRRRGRRARRVLLVLLTAVVVLPLVAVGVLWPLTPSVDDAEARIEARLASHGAKDPHAVPRPDKVGIAVIATEDSRFYRHHGLDALGVVRAAMSAISGSHHDFGGATLDQQLAKNLYTSNSLPAKVEQVVLSFKLEAQYSKSQILEMYLSEVYLGHGFYGLPAASRGYFGVAPADLTWAQASVLAGLVQAPSAYDPYSHRDLAKSRQRHVLDRLVAIKTLTAAQADAAYSAPLNLQ